MLDVTLAHVVGEEATKTAQELARREGIFTGTSGGGVLAVALRKAATLPKGSSVLCMLPDTGERYLSTPLCAALRWVSNPVRVLRSAHLQKADGVRAREVLIFVAHLVCPMGAGRFDDVPADMNAEEQALFDAAPPTEAFPQPLPEPTDAARSLVADFVKKDKVAIVAMESCE